MLKNSVVILILFLTLLTSDFLFAGVETTGTVPQGVYSPEFIFGVVSGLGQKFDNSGQLVGVADQYHLDLTGSKISQLSAEGASLVQALNAASPGFGETLTMGTVDFNASPSLDYFVINPAYGLKSNVAIGFALPLIHFRNHLQVSASAANENVQAVQSHAGGLPSGELKNGLERAASMASNLPSTVMQAIIEKGYYPLGDVDIKTPGDTQLYLRYRYFENKKWRLAGRPYIVLPKGRPDNPDDLGDIALGGVLGTGIFLTQEYVFNKYFESSFVVQYESHLPTVVSKRVPKNHFDILPAQDQKQGVNYNPGNISDILVAAKFFPVRWLITGAFWGMTFKDPDWYDGDQAGYDYSFMSQDSGYKVQRAGGYVEFKTTDFYFEKSFAVPLIVGYTFSTTLAAVNSPQSTSHVFNLRMFF